MLKIGIQGGKGSFSETVGEVFAKNHGIENFEIIFQISSEKVLNGIENGSTDFGIFAMENAQGGVVIESVKALAEHQCKIVEMFHIPISQNLLVLHNVHIGDITEIHSHHQALRQCRNYLLDNFWTRPLLKQMIRLRRRDD